MVSLSFVCPSFNAKQKESGLVAPKEGKQELDETSPCVVLFGRVVL